jgi:hypothetical protein
MNLHTFFLGLVESDPRENIPLGLYTKWSQTPERDLLGWAHPSGVGGVRDLYPKFRQLFLG